MPPPPNHPHGTILSASCARVPSEKSSGDSIGGSLTDSLHALPRTDVDLGPFLAKSLSDGLAYASRGRCHKNDLALISAASHGDLLMRRPRTPFQISILVDLFPGSTP